MVFVPHKYQNSSRIFQTCEYMEQVNASYSVFYIDTASVYWCRLHPFHLLNAWLTELLLFLHMIDVINQPDQISLAETQKHSHNLHTLITLLINRIFYVHTNPSTSEAHVHTWCMNEFCTWFKTTCVTETIYVATLCVLIVLRLDPILRMNCWFFSQSSTTELPHWQTVNKIWCGDIAFTSRHDIFQHDDSNSVPIVVCATLPWFRRYRKPNSFTR